MLTLTRKRGEHITIGKDIVVTVVEIDRGRVQIGITAPRHLRIHRADDLFSGEVFQQKGQHEKSTFTPRACSGTGNPTSTGKDGR